MQAPHAPNPLGADLYFSKPILTAAETARCLGFASVNAMYLDELTNSSWSDYFSELATRYACIKLWLRRRRHGRDYGWLAIEQGRQLHSWPESERGHLICGLLSQAGMEEELAIKLRGQDKTGHR